MVIRLRGGHELEGLVYKGVKELEGVIGDDLRG